jgi:excisionase family DNA binding protein
MVWTVTFEEAMDEPLLTVEQVAEFCQVHRETVGKWLRQGTLKGIRLGTGRRGPWRVEPSEVRAFLDKCRGLERA